MPLTDDDLAYMRETQANHRPTAANLVRRTETPDGMGGTTTTSEPPVPVQVRLSGGDKDQIPDVVADRWGPNVVQIVMDLMDVTAGDMIDVTATEGYEVVSHGDPDRWATAQVVYGIRTVWPAGGVT